MTTILAIVGIFQLVFFRRADKTSRITAEAALQSAQTADRALRQIERPWLFVENLGVQWRIIPGNPMNAWFADIEFRNVGRMPAIVSSLLTWTAAEAELPEIPEYSLCLPLGIPITVGADKTVKSDQCGPVPGRPEHLVFYGKLIYCGVGGDVYETAFAFAMAPTFPAAVPYKNDNYRYYK